MSDSIRQRLLNVAQSSKRSFQEILQYYAMERFLYRFSNSPYKNKFILKGALMFTLWNLSPSRATRDIDFLGITSNNPDKIHKLITDICQIDCDNDGIEFLHKTIECQSIQEQNEYRGIRAIFFAELNKAKIKMQIDIGFGDVIHPSPINFEYPTLLNMQSPKIKGYTAETLISEKLHTMCRHGISNSRMKDIYDVWLLSRQFDFSSDILSEAIQKTFENRRMNIKNQEFQIFTQAFKKDPTKNLQWNAFINKNILSIVPDNFSEALNQIELFISPPILEKTHPKMNWIPPGPWKADVQNPVC